MVSTSASAFSGLPLELSLNTSGRTLPQNVRVKPRAGQIKLCDLFAGGGGTSCGAVWALDELGVSYEAVNINHCQDAISTHELNYPGHIHLCTGVDDVSPRGLFEQSYLDFLAASPVCTHISSARGGTPVNPQLRSTSWQVVRWTRAKKPKVFLVENVPELLSWGPVMQMRSPRGVPHFLKNVGTEKKTKWVKCFAPGGRRPTGLSTKTWWSQLESIGLKPAFTPDPKHKGETFVKWMTHLRREGYEVQCRVCNAADYGAPTSRKRLFILGARIGSGYRVVWPKPTHAKPDANGNVPPGMLPWVGARTIINWNLRGGSIFERETPLKAKTLHRIITGLRKFGLRPSDSATAETAFLTPGFSERPGQTPRTHSVDGPMPTICASGHTHLARAFFVKYRGTNNAADLNAPAPTITANGTHLGLVEPFLVQVAHGAKPGAKDGARCKSLADPVPVICGNRGDLALCSSFLTQVSHGVGKKEKSPHARRVKSVDDPIPALTCSNDWGVTSFLLGQQSGGAPRDISGPSPTISTVGAVHLIEALVPILSDNGAWRQLETDILYHAQHPGTGRPRIQIGGEVVELDIFHRMLDDEELARAQSFPRTYRFAGNKTSRIKQIGNAVAPLMARALVKALWSQNEDVGVMPAEILTRAA